MSLFYHAGIKNEQVASWVGLGWNLNAGAINRQTLGVPDDWNGKTMASLGYKDLQTSTSTNNFNIGASIFGLSAGAGFDWGSNQSLGVTGTASAFGVLNASTASGGGSRVGTPDLRYDLQGSFYTAPITIPIPGTGGSVNLGYTHEKRRYYYTNAAQEENWGVLYTQNGYQSYPVNQDPTQLAQVDGRVLDSYSNPYDGDSYDDPNDYEQHNNLAFPAYDRFNVAANGLGGVFSAKFLEHGTLARDRAVLSWYEYLPNKFRPFEVVNYWNKDEYQLDPSNIHFTMMADGHASLQTAPGQWNLPPYNNSSTAQHAVAMGNYQGPGSQPTPVFYNGTRNKLGSSQVIEWFTNDEIVNDPAGARSRGFLEYESIPNRLDADRFDQDGIGAFVIFKEGYAYHFTLPVYQFEMIDMTENRTDPSQEFYTRLQVDKFAYSWLLTGVTGPDYVDKGPNGLPDGILNQYDEGTWVKFDYGLWSDGYNWRTPAQQYEDLGASNLGRYSIGCKQVYYLNSAETKTHIAFFIKGLREDAIARDTLLNKSLLDPLNVFEIVGNQQSVRREDRHNVELDVPQDQKLLRLEGIVLFRKQHVPSGFLPWHSNVKIAPVALGSFDYEFSRTYLNIFLDPISTSVMATHHRDFGYHYADNVYDINDVLYNPYLPATPYADALQVVRFGYTDPAGNSYTLAKDSPNSDAFSKGRLSLHKLLLHGQGDQAYAPSYEFEYSDHGNYRHTATDDWGYYAWEGYQDVLPAFRDVCPKAHADNWSLSRVHLPQGGWIEFDYESDSYRREAVFGQGLEATLQTPLQYDQAQGRFYFDLPEGPWAAYDCILAPGTTVSITKTKEVEDLNVPSSNTYVTNHLCNLAYISGGRYYLDSGCSSIYEPNSNNNHVLITVFYELTFEATDLIGYGGGLRVKEVRTDEGDHQYATRYDYDDPVDLLSSGITSYAPLRSDRFIPYPFEIPGPGVLYGLVTTEQVSDNGETEGKTRQYFEVLANGGDLGDQEFRLGDQWYVEDLQGNKAADYYSHQYQNASPHNRNDHYFARVSVIHDKTSRLGRLNAVEKIDAFGATLQKELYHYDDYRSDGRGVVQESVSDVKTYGLPHDQNGNGVPFQNSYFTTASRKWYPNILKSVETLIGNVASTTEFDQFDDHTGQPLRAESSNGYGERVRLEAIPAYEEYATLGSKALDLTHTNLLGAIAATKTTVSDDNGASWEVLNATASTWGNSWKYREKVGNAYETVLETNPDRMFWRTGESHSWKGYLHPDGTFDKANNGTAFDEYFDLANPSGGGWEQISEITLFSRNSRPLEAKDINGRYLSSKLGYGDQQMVLANCTNARYTEFAFSGAEDPISGTNYFGGEVKGYNNNLNSDPAYVHTGQRSLRLGQGIQYGFFYGGEIGNSDNDEFKPGRTYRANVWIRMPAGQLPGTYSVQLYGHLFDASGNTVYWTNANAQSSTTFKAGNWYLLTLDIPLDQYPNAKSLHFGTWLPGGPNSATVYLDDFRVQPLDGKMVSFTYDPQTGRVVEQLNADHLASRFLRDEAGRIVETQKEYQSGFRRVEQRFQNFARDIE